VILLFVVIFSPVRVYSGRPVSTYICFGETNLLDNNLNEISRENGYSTVSDKSSMVGMGANGRLHNNIYWNLYADFYTTHTEYSNNSLYISHSLTMAGISYKLFEKEKFRVMPGIGFGAGQSWVEVMPAFPGFGALDEEVEYPIDFPLEPTIFDKYYFLFNAQFAVDKSLHLGSDRNGDRCLLLLGMRTGFYLTLDDSKPDLGGVEISNFPENNLDNYYLNFIIGLQFRKAGR
jgi:hypothetical protein